MDELISSCMVIFTLNVSEIESLQFMPSHYITSWGSLVIGAMNQIQRDLNAASDLGSSHYSPCICWSVDWAKISIGQVTFSGVLALWSSFLVILTYH